MSTATPDAALAAWTRTIPAVRCAAPAFRPWTGAQDSAALVPVTPTSGTRFAAAGFSGAVLADLTVVADGRSRNVYALARAPSAHAVVLHAGSEALEEAFTAVVAADAPPRAVAVLRAAPRAGALGLGSTRAAVERALGPGRAKHLCDFMVVRYQPVPAEISNAEMWFFYRDGVVVAIARYEAV
ncbi:MAG: hypothetical protein JO225_09055 [Candidatus Eremiobacteraeota bacterium]|nr:hypothetical protein [Candidatus Eremiobacteraeota bacterium]MBV8644049.1 hypothetical protein [Candidatus Eremiobacteraeota bacterium]